MNLHRVANLEKFIRAYNSGEINRRPLGDSPKENLDYAFRVICWVYQILEKERAELCRASSIMRFIE